jgi:DNA invertase Pin-like site-specific DNA recombinase
MPPVIGIRFGRGIVSSTRSDGGRPVRLLPFHCRDRQLGQMLGGFFERVCQEYPQRPQVHCTTFSRFSLALENQRAQLTGPFQEMLSFCKQHRCEVDCVVVQDLSRFARNNSDQALCIAELKKHGIKLYSVFEQNIGDTAAGKLAANIHGTFNQYFSDALSEKMKERMEASAASGRFPWPAPVGYLNVKGSPNIVPDPVRAPLIARAFELVAAGHKRADVLKIINDAGLRTKLGNRLSGQTFHALTGEAHSGRGAKANEPTDCASVALSFKLFLRTHPIAGGTAHPIFTVLIPTTQPIFPLPRQRSFFSRLAAVGAENGMGIQSEGRLPRSSMRI